MTRALPGPGDFAHDPGSAPECLDCRQPGPTCECQRCAQCADRFGCHVECSVCHRFTDEYEVGEGTDPTCVDCLVAAMEDEADQRERDECALEDKGDEMRERSC